MSLFGNLKATIAVESFFFFFGEGDLGPNYEFGNGLIISLIQGKTKRKKNIEERKTGYSGILLFLLVFNQETVNN